MHTLHKQALAFESATPQLANVSETIPTKKILNTTWLQGAVERDSVVGTASGYRVNGSGIESR